MRYILIFCLMMLLPAQAFAKECVALVFYDATISCSPAAPPCAAQMDPIVFADWADVASLTEDAITDGLPVAGVYVFYTQFGIAGGPSIFEGDVDAFGLHYIAPNSRQARESLLVADYFRAPADAGTSLFIAALDATEDVEAQFGNAPANLEAFVLNDTDLIVFAGVTSETATLAVGLNLSCP